jgi:hypothetical protein
VSIHLSGWVGEKGDVEAAMFKRASRSETQETHSANARTVVCSYEEMALSQLLFKYLWPFWMFKDANNGDRFARAAAYRHNRDMRIYLPSYLRRWSVSSAAFLVAALLFGAGAHAHESEMFLDLMTAASGMVFAFTTCVLVVTTYIYIHLTHIDG